MDKGVEKKILEMRKQLEKEEVEYLQALELLSSKDGALGVLKSLKTRLAPLMMYDPHKDPAHAAVFVIGSMVERLAGLFQDLQFIEEYEDRKEEYKAALKAHLGEDEPEANS